MKNALILVALMVAISLLAMAEEWTGYIADSKCAGAGRGGSEKHANCAEKCIKGGLAAVLVTEDGKVYKIADQAKVTNHAGHKVTITGKLDGDTIKVDSLKM